MKFLNLPPPFCSFLTISKYPNLPRALLYPQRRVPFQTYVFADPNFPLWPDRSSPGCPFKTIGFPVGVLVPPKSVAFFQKTFLFLSKQSPATRFRIFFFLDLSRSFCALVIRTQTMRRSFDLPRGSTNLLHVTAVVLTPCRHPPLILLNQPYLRHVRRFGQSRDLLFLRCRLMRD